MLSKRDKHSLYGQIRQKWIGIWDRRSQVQNLRQIWLTYIAELIIDSFSPALSTNLRSGSIKPKSIVIIATNFDIKDIERYILSYKCI